MTVATLARPKNYTPTWMATQPDKKMTKTKKTQLFAHFNRKLAAYGITANDTRWSDENILWNCLQDKSIAGVSELVLEHAYDCNLETIAQLQQLHHRGW